MQTAPKKCITQQAVRILLVTNNNREPSRMRRLLQESNLYRADFSASTSLDHALAVDKNLAFDICLVDLDESNYREILNSHLWSSPHPPVVCLYPEQLASKALQLIGVGASDCIPKKNLNPESLWVAVNFAIAREHKMQEMVDRLSTAREKRRALETQLQQKQKLESLGLLAGGIAHDFNNLLMAIMGNASLALMELPQGSRLRRKIELINKTSKRAGELTKQLLAYSGKGKLSPQKIDLSSLVKEMLDLLSTATSKKANLECNFADERLLIEADATQIRQVVMNLITNASDALEKQSGKISVETGSFFASRKYLSETFADTVLHPGVYAYLEVSDTGNGIPEDNIIKIFDPFFTTKSSGRGLGLAAVLGIVRSHGGAIKVDSAVGNGTCITVLLPVASNGISTAEQQIPEQIENKWRGSGLILVVDDESSVRDVTSVMVSTFGFDVIPASNGREGLELYRQNSERIIAVLLDLTMPEMNGEETYWALRNQQRDIPIILLSGYSEHDAEALLGQDSKTMFLQKPFEPSALGHVMQNLLS